MTLTIFYILHSVQYNHYMLYKNKYQKISFSTLFGFGTTINVIQPSKLFPHLFHILLYHSVLVFSSSIYLMLFLVNLTKSNSLLLLTCSLISCPVRGEICSVPLYRNNGFEQAKTILFQKPHRTFGKGCKQLQNKWPSNIISTMPRNTWNECCSYISVSPYHSLEAQLRWYDEIDSIIILYMCNPKCRKM